MNSIEVDVKEESMYALYHSVRRIDAWTRSRVSSVGRRERALGAPGNIERLATMTRDAVRRSSRRRMPVLYHNMLCNTYFFFASGILKPRVSPLLFQRDFII